MTTLFHGSYTEVSSPFLNQTIVDKYLTFVSSTIIKED